MWNPYVGDKPIFRLKGHTHALCGATVLPDTPQVITADVKGTFRLWDMRNFRCVQVFGGTESLDDLNAFCALPAHRRLAAAAAKISFFDYEDEASGAHVTDPVGVTDVVYSDITCSFYTFSKCTIKEWSGASGTLTKIMRDVVPNEITAVTLGPAGSRICYVGDSQGRVCSYSLGNGSKLKEFDRHHADISCVSVWEEPTQGLRVASASWDGVLKISVDIKSERPLCKGNFECHTDGIVCMAHSPKLQLLATGGADAIVNFFDVRTFKLEHTLRNLSESISAIEFITSRGLVIIGDFKGEISAMYVRPHDQAWLRKKILRKFFGCSARRAFWSKS